MSLHISHLGKYLNHVIKSKFTPKSLTKLTLGRTVLNLRKQIYNRSNVKVQLDLGNRNIVKKHKIKENIHFSSLSLLVNKQTSSILSSR